MEQWKPIEGHDKYEVSDEGRVRNSKTGRVLKTRINERGYTVVQLHRNNVPLTERVHRLVAKAFHPCDDERLDVNHIDGNKLNNSASNLEFCSRQYNVQHAFRTGLKQPSREKRVRVIETGEEFRSIRECGRALGLDQTSITQCVLGKAHTCGGYHFEEV